MRFENKLLVCALCIGITDLIKTFILDPYYASGKRHELTMSAAVLIYIAHITGAEAGNSVGIAGGIPGYGDDIKVSEEDH